MARAFNINGLLEGNSRLDPSATGVNTTQAPTNPPPGGGEPPQGGEGPTPPPGQGGGPEPPGQGNPSVPVPPPAPTGGAGGVTGQTAVSGVQASDITGGVQGSYAQVGSADFARRYGSTGQDSPATWFRRQSTMPGPEFPSSRGRIIAGAASGGSAGGGEQGGAAPAIAASNDAGGTPQDEEWQRFMNAVTAQRFGTAGSTPGGAASGAGAGGGSRLLSSPAGREFMDARNNELYAAQDLFNKQSPEDQAAIRATWNQPYVMNQNGVKITLPPDKARAMFLRDWYNNANGGGR